MMTPLDRLEALADKAQRAAGHIETDAHVDLWVCDVCGFSFDAVHKNATDNNEDVWDCPCCLEAAVWPLLPDLIRVARAVSRGDINALAAALLPLFAEVES